MRRGRVAGRGEGGCDSGRRITAWYAVEAVEGREKRGAAKRRKMTKETPWLEAGGENGMGVGGREDGMSWGILHER